MRISRGIVKLREVEQSGRKVRLFTLPDSVEVKDLVGKKFKAIRTVTTTGRPVIFFVLMKSKSKVRINAK